MKKSRKKRLLATAVAIAMTGGLLAGCGKTAQTEAGPAGGSSSEKSGEGDITLAVWAWDVALMQLKDCAAKYQEEHPNVKFDFVEMGTDQVYKKLSTSLSTGNGIADIIQIEGDVITGYEDKFPEGFLDLSDILTTDDFVQSKINECVYNGKTHAFPWDAGPMGFFYRTDYFEQAGVEAGSIKTWDDLIEAGKKVEAVCKTPGGDPVKMLPVNPQRTNLYTMIRNELGTGLFDADGKPIVNNDNSIKAMEKAKQIYDSGICLDYNGWDEYEQCVVNESVACIPEAVWMIGTIKDKSPKTEGKWASIALPAIDGGKYSCNNGGSDLAANAKTKYPEQVKDFIKFALTDKELQIAGLEKYGLYPSYKPSYDAKIFTAGDPFFSGNVYAPFVEASNNIADIPASPNVLEANDEAAVSCTQVYLNGADVKQTFDALQENFENKYGH
ncbi:ABC transporter substrate-binding protein [Lachnoclostridium sp. Marseille-P6806]|uniref:ABC transporter substrate-binding protein n=1 Tax=Lachnoclostridium sp. Marseille-P6806 TaxID=2364793 RepID=UPI001F5E8336|nr:extracellular solute-binding protein [Lachnoclostridium sp. Marseille-P6806]